MSLSSTTLAFVVVGTVMLILLLLFFYRRYRLALAARSPHSGSRATSGTRSKRKGPPGGGVRSKIPSIDRAYRGDGGDDCTAEDDDLEAHMQAQGSVLTSVRSSIEKVRRLTGSKTVPEHKLSLSKHDSAQAMD